jgi:hypothetical protein
LVLILGSDSIFSWSNKQKAETKDITDKAKERLEDKKIDLAEKIIESFHKTKDAILRISNPFSAFSEIETAEEEMKNIILDPEDNKKAIKQGLIFANRFSKEGDIFNNLYSLKIKARMFFGDELGTFFDEIKKIIDKDILVSISMLTSGTSIMDKKDKGFSMIIWDLSRKEDIRIDEIINKIEKILIPLLRDK